MEWNGIAGEEELGLEELSCTILSSSTSRRRAALNTLQEKLSSSDVTANDYSSIARLLFCTYPFYSDRPSRKAIQRCIRAFFAPPSDETSQATFIKELQNESTKAGIASTNAFVLVEWCSVLLQELVVDQQRFEKWAYEIVSANARALETCLASTTKESVKKSAIIVTRRALRKVFSTEGLGRRAVEQIIPLLTKSRLGCRENAVFLGVVAGVCARLPSVRGDLEKQKSSIYEFYTKEIIGSRTPVPFHTAEGLHDFFHSFSTLEDVQKEIVPSLEKALLRAPEVALSGLIPPLVQALPEEIDLSEILHARLLKPLLTNVKSTNADIRSGAIASFGSLASRSNDETWVQKTAEEIIVPLKTAKPTNAEHRALHAQMLSAISPSSNVSLTIVSGLTTVCAKEASENALLAESSALCQHFSQALKLGTSVDKNVFEVIAKGCGDKRNPFRKAWILGVGEALWELDEDRLSDPSFPKECAPILAKLSEVFEEIAANPLPFAQGGLVTMAYIATTLSQSKHNWTSSSAGKPLLDRRNISQKALAMSPKPSFLLNSRIYTKLTSAKDISWILRALAGLSKNLEVEQPDSISSDAWSQALLYFLTATDIPPEARREAARTLTQVYRVLPGKIGKVVILGIWHWVQALEQGEKDSAAFAAKSDLDKLDMAVKAITPSPSERDNKAEFSTDHLQNQMISLLVLCQPALISRSRWIDIAIRSSIDPGDLARQRAGDCLNQIIQYTEMSPQAKFERVKVAAYQAAAELAFVAPDSLIPEIVKQIESDLDVTQMANIGPTEAAITRTPEGVPFVDVLGTAGKNHLSDKNIKDYDTLKWEEELKSQIAKKKGQQRKLTADEAAKVNTQLAKEAKIRKEVLDIERRIRRGAGIAQHLAAGPPTDAAAWLNQVMRAVLAMAKTDAGLLVGDVISTAVISCSARVTARLGTLRPFIGVATLRALGEPSLPAEYLNEPLGDLVTRVLYRIRFAADQRPLDVVSFGYVLPLTLLVLERRGVGYLAGDEADEQILLALEFLSLQTDTCADFRLPRAEIISHLIFSMQKFTQHYRLIKDTLVDLCRCISSNIQSSELHGLLRGCIVPESSVRTAVLQAIHAEIDLIDLDFSEQIWLECHDNIDENVEIADAIWEENALETDERSGFKMLPYLKNSDFGLRNAAAKALAHAIQFHNPTFPVVLDHLQGEYRKEAEPKVPQRDAYGMLKKMDLNDPWEARSGVALAFREMTKVFETARIVPFMEFLISDGPLGDRNATVRQQMVESGTALIAARGKEKVEDLMKLFRLTLETSDKATERSDWINEAVVVLYGSLARHLAREDDRLRSVVDILLNALITPSESVQFAVAECISPLVPLLGLEVSKHVQRMLDQLFQARQYAARRGAAYGLAGIVSGRGIAALREYRIMSALRGAIENKKDQNYRQGALFAYELLSLILGRIFEPYIIQIVPQLLSTFGDPNADVREACLDTAKTCFASLSSYGVQQILPTLLEGLDESQWRSKKGACDLLGAMAYLDPQQLASSLPDIIPPLTSVLNDSHKEVRAAANRSLQRFGEVISNPEVKSLVGILLKALSDPTKYTEDAMDALIKVSFLHYLDAPSLALVVRILERGLGDRSTSKRKAAQIIGSLAHLTERKDLTSHLPILVSGLKVAIVDPVPTTRATSSKALGSLIEKLGEDALPDLIPSLMATLKSDTGAGDRLGSAQALSEVLAGLGTGRLEETLPSILQNVSSSKPAVREGFISLFIFLPACFGNSFANYLNKIIPPILAGLADDIESIRETSLRAGRLLVKNFATKAIDLLLPELERGLADDSHRIRLSSVELVGDLLFNLTGITAGQDNEDEEEEATQAGQSLLEVLGEEKRNKILSSLYICRCDTSGLVRSAAIAVWKALVATPRTLKELVPTLSQLIIRRLASSNPEQKVIAGNALGELIRKAGEGVLSTLLPTLEEGLQSSTDTDSREGICIALRELISSASPEILEEYEKTLISVIRMALVDQDPDVREAAAEAFDSLQRSSGKKVVDQILPYLLNLLRSEDEADQALSALLTLLTEATRSNIILPNLVPTLLASPITSFNAKALASLAEVAGSSMTRRLPTILNALMENLVNCKNEDLKADLDSAFDSVLLSVDEFDGLNTAMGVILGLQKHDDHRKRAAAATHLAKFFSDAEVDFSRYNQDLIRVLLISFDDRDSDVVKAAWTALTQLMSHLRKEEMESLVFSTRQILQQVGVAGSNLPGFALPKGINAILPIFLQGLMNGTPEQRTQSALAISDIIDRTNAESLKPFVTQITGPLIRVVSERSIDVKCAIILTLNHLLEKIPLFLKPFLPQLQRTFAKSLADTSSETLRIRAAKALGTLITLTPRVDPLIAELVTGSKTQDAGVKNAMLKALYEVVSKAGGNMSDTSRQSVLGLIDGETDTSNDSMAISNAHLLGALVKNLPSTNATTLLKQRVLTTHFTNPSVLNLNSVLLESPLLLIESFPEETPSVICEGIGNKNPFVADNCVLAAGKLLLTKNAYLSFESKRMIFEALAPAMQPGGPVDTRRLALVVIRTVSRTHPDMVKPHLAVLVPPVFASVRDPVIPVKLAAEAAFLQIFSVVEDESFVFDKYIAGPGADLQAMAKRSMQDYFKRVALRLGSQARERKEAEGGQGGLGLSGDEADDEREVWSVGKVDLGEGAFSHD